MISYNRLQDNGPMESENNDEKGASTDSTSVRGVAAMSASTRLYGAIEAGGTKFVCAIGDHDGQILDETRIETRDPTTTLTDVCRYFHAAGHKFGDLTAIGVGAFGPLDLKLTSPHSDWRRRHATANVCRYSRANASLAARLHRRRRAAEF
jgi:hypothetical protein